MLICYDQWFPEAARMATLAARAKTAIEARFGERSLWMLNPGDDAFTLPSHATGADYMLQWTMVLEGPGGLGADFDLFYFSGPSDFAPLFIDFGYTAHFLFDGALKHTDPSYKPLLWAIAIVTIKWLMLYLLYLKRIFLRV